MYTLLCICSDKNNSLEFPYCLAEHTILHQSLKSHHYLVTLPPYCWLLNSKKTTLRKNQKWLQNLEENSKALRYIVLGPRKKTVQLKNRATLKS